MQSTSEVAERTNGAVPDRKRYPITEEAQRRLEAAFRYHPPKGDQVERYHDVRQEALILALSIVQRTPPGREQALALTHLEQAVMWANAAIARGE